MEGIKCFNNRSRLEERQLHDKPITKIMNMIMAIWSSEFFRNSTTSKSKCVLLNRALKRRRRRS